MQVLTLAASGLFVPLVSQSVLAEFVQRAVSHGIGGHTYAYDDVRRWLEALAPLLDRAQPVGLRDLLPSLLRYPMQPLRRLLQSGARQWPEGLPPEVLAASADRVDPGDLHVMLAAVELGADVLVTSNVEDFVPLTEVCDVEPPSVFLRRFL